MCNCGRAATEGREGWERCGEFNVSAGGEDVKELGGGDGEGSEEAILVVLEREWRVGSLTKYQPRLLFPFSVLPFQLLML